MLMPLAPHRSILCLSLDLYKDDTIVILCPSSQYPFPASFTSCSNGSLLPGTFILGPFLDLSTEEVLSTGAMATWGGEDIVGGLHCGYCCETLLPGLNTASVAPSPFAQGCRISVEEDLPKEARVTVCRDVNETSTTI